MLTSEEWTSIGDKFKSLAPIFVVVIVVFIIGYLAGYSQKGTEISLDCKYAAAFRVDVNSFECHKKF